jgi:response regulator RpfG family c-di-GMP phosphodiesterase
LLEQPHWAAIPVVVVTGVSRSDAAAVERVDEMLSKPFDFKSLLTIVDRHVGSRTSTDEQN